MSDNTNLARAKNAKNDEFYTQYEDIEKEISHYESYLKGKIVYCNCDDPEWSNFWKFFHLNFARLGLKRLISTHFEKYELSYRMDYDGGNDNDISIGIKTPLIFDGDFQTPECIDILCECDVVVTNCPFSLFKEYIRQLMDYRKDFIVIGSMNGITLKDVFPLLKDDKVRIGYCYPSKFILPNGGGVQKFGNICWYTTFPVSIHNNHLPLTKSFSQADYRKYDNCYAFNVDKVKDIPKDDSIDVIINKSELEEWKKIYPDLDVLDDDIIRIYNPVYGVPMTLMLTICLEQFEIVGFQKFRCEDDSKIDGEYTYNRVFIRRKEEK